MSASIDSRTPSFIDDDRPVFLAHLREATTTPSPVSDILSDPSLVRVLTRPSTPRRSSSRHSSKTHKSSNTETELPLLSLVLNEEGRQSNQLKMLLSSTADRLEYEMRRADAAERRAEYAEARLKQANDRIINMTVTQHRTEIIVTQLTEESKRSKMMLENTQAEFSRAQTTIDDLEDQKTRAETEARHSRDVARQYERALNERDAKEMGRLEGLKDGGQRFVDGILEGRREGFETAKRMERARRKKIHAAAFEAGRMEGFDEGSAHGRASERRNAMDAFDRFLENEEYSDESSPGSASSGTGSRRE